MIIHLKSYGIPTESAQRVPKGQAPSQVDCPVGITPIEFLYTIPKAAHRVPKGQASPHVDCPVSILPIEFL